MPARLLPTGQALISKRRITPTESIDKTTSTIALQIFIILPSADGNVYSFLGNTYAFFYDITFDIMISKEITMFHYAISFLYDLSSYLVSSCCFWPHIFNFPENFIRRRTICIVHGTTDFEIVGQIVLQYR